MRTVPSIQITRKWGMPAEISCYPWDVSGYRPHAEVLLKYNDEALYVQFNVKREEYIKAVYKKHGEPVFKDSCVEFFINFLPDISDDYLNFEINPLGALVLGYGFSRRRSTPSGMRAEGFKIKPRVWEKGWSVEYRIPLEFIQELFPGFTFEKGRRLRGNFYKCGDDTKIPHYGCWSKIECETPDFHRPEYFGELELA